MVRYDDRELAGKWKWPDDGEVGTSGRRVKSLSRPPRIRRMRPNGETASGKGRDETKMRNKRVSTGCRVYELGQFAEA